MNAIMDIDRAQEIYKAKTGEELSMKEIADMLGVTYQSLWNWKHGKGTKLLLALLVLSNKVGVSPNELIKYANEQ